MTNSKTLFLAWQDKALTRKWFPVGQLDVLKSSSLYHFRYIRGAEEAQKQTGFLPLCDFPDFYRSYESSELFPLFKNRVLAPARPDFQAYLKQLNLSEHADPVEILSVDGGYRATDSFEVFPKIERGEDGAFRCRFFLHGWQQHVNESAQQRLKTLKPDEKLYVTIELTNPATQLAVQIQTEDYHMIGWAPSYLLDELVQALAAAPSDYKAKVVRINEVPAPSKQRVLVELSGHWPANYAPMTTQKFQPLKESSPVYFNQSA
ncbi:MAG: DNA-binding protein [Nitrospirae bacterium]|nr:DNA-binding protein [Candidatus Troglogloeales bacterium]